MVNGLDSHDAVEVDAAIYAADKFSAMSKWVITGEDLNVNAYMYVIYQNVRLVLTMNWIFF